MTAKPLLQTVNFLRQNVRRAENRFPPLRRITRAFRNMQHKHLDPYIEVYVRGNSPILVYTAGRVGTMSVSRSLDQVFPPHMLGYLHSFDPANANQFMVPRHADETRSDVQRVIQKQHTQAQRCRALTEKYPNVKLITLVRDPIARNVSLFLWIFTVNTGLSLEQAQSLSIAELTDLYLRTMRHATPVIWFEQEMQRTFGIDVYQYPFPVETGYQHIKRGKFDVLILKGETDDSIKERAIIEFTGNKDFRLLRSNSSAERAKDGLYQRFMEHVCLPTWYIESLYRTRYMQHFYSPAEIARFRAKWSRDSAAQRSDS